MFSPKLKALFQLLRWRNLLVIVLTQALLFLVLGSSALAWRMSFSTLLLAAAGYLINDLLDLAIDRRNRPDRPLPSGAFNPPAVQMAYWWINVIALLLVYDAPRLLLLHAFCFLGLWAYSRYWKRQPGWGNIAVALFCALVVWEWLLLPLSSDYSIVLGIYGGFAFFANLIRELVKDQEDALGDAAEGVRSLPIVYGKAKSKLIGFGQGLLLLIFEIGITFYYWQQRPIFAIYSLFLSLPLLFLLKKGLKAKDKADFSRLSSYWKAYMLLGLCLLLLW